MKLQKIRDFMDSKPFIYFIQSLIIISIISFTLETVSEFNNEFSKENYILEMITISIFTLEYLIRIFIARPIRKFVFSFYGIIDLLAIAPFYISTGIDLRAVRIFRLFRLFKLFRYSKAIDRYTDAFKSIKKELAVFLSATAMFLYMASAGIYFFENKVQPEVFSSIPSSFWWAVTTLTTVGYGDMYPITFGGKMFTSIIVVLGLGVIAVPTGLFASALTKNQNQNNTKLKGN